MPDTDDTPLTPDADDTPLPTEGDLPAEELPLGVQLRSLEHEMNESYLVYAMSVIVSRALPDVRDGLKPVHRRILYVMHEMGLRSGAKFKKSANVVGEVLGKYHPHGDSSVYDAMVRMAQDFSMRYMLVNGQGNFGSIDGDSAAAYRYTEAKMTRLTEDLIKDIEKDTVDFRDNYDGSRKEPVVLPARFPNLLLNGTTGIAVGMATNIPPHNLGELVDGLVYLIDNADATTEDLMRFIKGPDFPTGGVIYNKKALLEAYSTGRGSIPVRGKAEIEESKTGKPQIIITEIPYQVNKATMVEKIADLVRDKKIVGITDIRDESTREGIRVVIEMKKESYPQKVLNQLYKLTDLQNSFGFNMIALTDRGMQPHLLSLKQILEHFITHRAEVVRRRAEFDLRVAEERAHILEGLKLALDHIDAVISTIRASKTKEDAFEALMKKFKLSDRQAKAILEMRLSALAGLERKKIEDELAEKYALIAELKDLLSSEAKIRTVVKDELAELKEQYADGRRTKVLARDIGEFSAKDMIPNEDQIVMLTATGYIKRVAPSSFRQQRRGGMGVIGLTTKEEDEVKLMRHVKNHDDLMFFTNTGRVFRLPAYEVPAGTRQAKGTAVQNLIQIQSSETITAMRVVPEGESSGYLFFATRMGTVKKTPIEDFANVRKSGLIAVKLNEGDELLWVKGTTGDNEIVLISHEGQCCRFLETDVRSMGRAAAGVRGINLGKKGDFVVEMDVVRDPKTDALLTVTEKGLGKATLIDEYRKTSRGAGGVKTVNITEKTGKVAGAKVIPAGLVADLILITRKGQTIRMKLSDVPVRGRATQGVILMRATNDSIAGVSLLEVTEEEGTTQTDATAESIADSSTLPVSEDALTTPEAARDAAMKAADKADLARLIQAAKEDQKDQKKGKK